MYMQKSKLSGKYHWYGQIEVVVVLGSVGTKEIACTLQTIV